MVHLNGRTLGLQAIILCGPGTSLYPFSKADDAPKALLPIANVPMIYYPLEWCQKATVRSITIVALNEHRPALESYLSSTKFLNSAASKGLKKLDIPLTLETPSSIDDSLGTADLLRILFKNGKINGDFLVLPCDLVVTGVDLNQLISVWMVHQGKYGKDEAKKGGLAVWGRVKAGGGKTTGMLDLWQFCVYG
jgi:translation initiation factor eIF-2B subunit gamma